jgi:hypothetical protein
MAASRLASVVVQLVAQYLSGPERMRMARVSPQWFHAIHHPVAWKHVIPATVARPMKISVHNNGLAVRRMPVDVHLNMAEPHGRESDLMLRLRVHTITLTGRCTATTNKQANVHSQERARSMIHAVARAILSHRGSTAILSHGGDAASLPYLRQMSIINCDKTDAAVMFLRDVFPPRVQRIVFVSERVHELTRFLLQALPSDTSPVKLSGALDIHLTGHEVLLEQQITILETMLNKHPLLHAHVRCPPHDMLSSYDTLLHPRLRITPNSTSRIQRLALSTRRTYDYYRMLWEQIERVSTVASHVCAQLIGAFLGVLLFSLFKPGSSRPR